MSPSERDFKRSVSLASNAAFTLKTGADISLKSLSGLDYNAHASLFEHRPAQPRLL